MRRRGVRNCRGVYSSTIGFSPSFLSRLGNRLSPTPTASTLFPWLRMPAEDFFSSDQERDDSKNLT